MKKFGTRRRQRKAPVGRGLSGNDSVIVSQNMQQIGTRFITGTASTYQTNSSFTYANLVGPDLGGSRPVKIRGIKVEFAPQATGAPGLVQLSWYDIASAQNFPVTQVRPLNLIGRTVLRFKPPRNSNYWVVSNSATAALTVSLYNPSLSAVAPGLSAVVTCDYMMPDDSPSAI